MNGMNGHLPQPPLWQEARNTEGRVYYYNTITKATQWTKPEELMTPAERALADQPWKEYTAEGGRKYWHNTVTQATTWEMPDVYKEALAKEAPIVTPIAAPTFVAGGGFSQYDQGRDREPMGEARQISYGNDFNGSRPQAFVPANTDPDYATFEEAQAAFMKMLKRNNVSPDWTWEQTMRNIIKDSQYRALKDPKDRKAAFEKYAVDVRLQEKDRVKERLTKLRADFSTMLKRHPEIKHYTRWKTARPIIEGETTFRSSNDDNERRQLFEDYILELKRENVEREATQRKFALEELVEILHSLDLEPYTRWSEAQNTIQTNKLFQGDEKFKTLSKSDILTAFENHIKSLERTFNDSRQQQKTLKSRKERQNRDRFQSLLKELKAAGKIRAGSKWSSVHSLIKDDLRYTGMLGQPGSAPLDLFWDVVEEEERALRSTRNDVFDAMEDKRYEIDEKTKIEDFLALMHKDRRTANIDRDSLQLIFERLQEKASKRNEDDKHHAERQQRRAADGLRSYLKHLDPPVRSDDTYERVKPRIERSEEYLALPSDDLRRSAFDKFIRRLKEKEDEMEKDRAKRRERDAIDRSTYRDSRDKESRDRGERSHRSGGRHARPSRSPEPDAYEADRRKAIADREKNYRRTNAADTLLSPPRRSDDRGGRLDRDRDSDRPHRSRRDSPPPRQVERDRSHRDRLDDDRDRLYRRRGDPKGSVDELPYGDEKPSGSNGTSGNRRRRAESDIESAGSRRDSKRSRRERSPALRDQSPPDGHDRHRRPRNRTLPAAAASIPKDEPAIHSGSEEGEIEEE